MLKRRIILLVLQVFSTAGYAIDSRFEHLSFDHGLPTPETRQYL
jgi:hypothetical protein